MPRLHVAAVVYVTGDVRPHSPLCFPWSRLADLFLSSFLLGAKALCACSVAFNSGGRGLDEAADSPLLPRPFFFLT